MTKLFGRPVGWLFLFGVVSLAAVGLGACVAAAAGVPSGILMRNLAAWGVGALAAVALAAFDPPGARTLALGLLPLGLAASLFFPEVDGVRRWIDLGPVHLNAAMLLMPTAVVALATPGRRGVWEWAFPVSALLLLVAQPDASQATSLAAVTALVAAATITGPRLRLGVILAAALLAALAWLRPDPLAPVAEVEGIVGLAVRQSPTLGALALLLLTAVAAAPAMAAARSVGARLAGAALGLCLLGWAVMPFLGAFPVPLVGMGMSPIIGAWLGSGLLAAVLRAETVRPS